MTIKKKHRYLYVIYGKIIESDISFPWLEESIEKDIDVEIRLAHVPERYVENEDWDYFWKATEDYYYFSINGMCKILVQKDKIIVEQIKASMAFISEYLFGVCFGVLLQKNGVLPLHGSCVSTELGAVLFIGPSMIGKSTFAANLAARGFTVLADDICAIYFAEHNRTVVCPGSKKIRLTPLSLEKTHLRFREFTYVQDNSRKYSICTKNISADFHNTPLHSIYLLSTHTDPFFYIEQLKGVSCFVGLRDNLYCGSLSNSLNTTSMMFELLLKICQSTEIYLFKRPEAGFQLNKMTSTFLTHCFSNQGYTLNSKSDYH